MPRRVHVADLRPGVLTPDTASAHHLRSVLRLNVDDIVEAFDAAGRRGAAMVLTVEPTLTLRVGAIIEAPPGVRVTVAAAVPKGDRADWMIEKLSELGVARFVPLRTARSVVHPEGPSKFERWRRIAVEAARQSRRDGVLTIEPLTDLGALLPSLTAFATFFSTSPAAAPFAASLAPSPGATLLIGPEGGFTPDEEAAFVARGLTPASLGRTILRVETAAVLAAGLAMLSFSLSPGP